MLSYLKVSEIFKEGQEPNIRTLFDSLKDEAIAQVSFSIVNIASCLSSEHQIDNFLACVAVLVKQGTSFKIHVVFNFLNSSSQYDAVNE